MVALINSRFSRTILLLTSVWIFYGGLPACSHAEIVYEIIDLGTLGGNFSSVVSINDAGRIVGESAHNQGWVHATLFDATGAGNNIDLGTLEGGGRSCALSISGAGQIVGTAFTSEGLERATLFDPTGAGNNIDLGTLGGDWSRARSVNDAGQIVGPADYGLGVWEYNACLFDTTGVGNNVDLGRLGGDWSVAYSINNTGQIVGKAQGSEGRSHATLFNPTGAGDNLDLGTLGGDKSTALAINDSGRIVGLAENSSDDSRATLFDSTGAGNNIDLCTLGGDESGAVAINDAGQIVGWAYNSQRDYRATLFDHTGAGNNIDLNTLIDPASGWILISAHDINNSGWIVGNGFNPQVAYHAFLLVPINIRYSGGTGEPNDPYQIATTEDLILLGETPEDYDKHFILTANIDLDPNLPGRKVFDRAVISPDTDNSRGDFQGAVFCGVFDGNDHIISNLTIDTTGVAKDYLALFGEIRGENAEVKNISVVNHKIISGDGYPEFSGGLVGRNFNGSISKCSAIGSITGGSSAENLGGLCGHNDFGTISDCYAAGSVTGSGCDYLGGLCGESFGNIINCYATTTVVGKGESWNLGGLCGANTGTISNCYANCSVSSNNDDSVYLGGLCGENSGLISDCYSASVVDVSNASVYVGGLCGYNDINGYISNCFWDIEISGQGHSDGGTGKTTAEMQTASTFLEAGWDFVSETVNGPNDIWKMWDEYDYPRLIWEPGPNTPLVFVDINDPGFNGQMSKYEVTNAQYCDFLNAALASGDITIDGNDVIGASGSNSGEDYAGQRYYRCDGSGYTGYGATDGGASRIHYNEGVFNVDDGFGNHPVTYVSWYGAMAFANYYGYYLPAEDQWQAVADYDGTYIYGCGQTIDPGIANYRDSEHPDGTTPVGRFGIYGYGMSDIAGSVWEWTSSSLDTSRIFRGGGMGSIDSDCDVSIRGDGIPYANYWDIGFRVCR